MLAGRHFEEERMNLRLVWSMDLEKMYSGRIRVPFPVSQRVVGSEKPIWRIMPFDAHAAAPIVLVELASVICAAKAVSVFNNEERNHP